MYASRAKRLLRSILRVGDGRGFVVKCGWDRVVITAAHCLPSLPEAHSAAAYYDRTYKLLAPLGDEPSVMAECFFVDPIADIAILGTPETQEMFEEAEQYDELLQKALPLWVADVRLREEKLPDLVFAGKSSPYSRKTGEAPAWMFSLDGHPFRCTAHCDEYGPLWIEQSQADIVGGMSGSPIVADNGSAIGVLCTSAHRGGAASSREGGPNPRLATNLPGWFLRQAQVRRPRVLEEATR